MSIGSRAVELRSFHGDALLGRSPVPWATHGPQESLCAPATCTCAPQPETLKDEGMGKGSHCAENSLSFHAELT